MASFARRLGEGRCVEMPSVSANIGPAASFLSLLRDVTADLTEQDAIAFADQDDVWLPNKLERGLAALSNISAAEPALYCARQILVNAMLNQIGVSALPARKCVFPAALAQNVATGCTVMLNRAAARLVASSTPSPATVHDWWCYLLVTGAGGHLLQDPEPVILYRQHDANVVGAPASMLTRAVAALQRGPHVFMSVLRQHVAALAAQQNLLSEQARRDVAVVDSALNGGFFHKLAALRTVGLQRQTWIETLVFRCWFILG